MRPFYSTSRGALARRAPPPVRGPGPECGIMARPQAPRPSTMQLLFDLFPIIVFFVVYQVAGMYLATGATIAAMAVLMGVQWIRERKVSKMLLITGAMVAVLGAITIFFRNPLFLQWKPTVVNWLFAAAFL